MAQQSVRHFRKKGLEIPSLWKGVLVSIAATVIAVILFALIIGMTDLSDGVIRIVNQAIKILSIFLGVKYAIDKGEKNAIAKGALVGLIYMGAGVLIYSLLSGQSLSFLSYAIDVLMGVAAGGLSAMILGTGRSK